jgi:hypothetical protein
MVFEAVRNCESREEDIVGAFSGPLNWKKCLLISWELRNKASF